MIEIHIPLPAIISREHGRHNLIEGTLQDSDDSAGDTSSRVSCLLGVGVVTPAVVVLACVEDQTSAEDVVLAVKLDLTVHEVDFGRFAVVKDDIAEVTDVTDLVIGMAVVMSVGVEVTAGGAAALSDVSGLMDVEAVLAGGHAGHGTGDANVAVVLAGESHATSHAVAYKLDDSLLYYLFLFSGRS